MMLYHVVKQESNRRVNFNHPTADYQAAFDLFVELGGRHNRKIEILVIHVCEHPDCLIQTPNQFCRRHAKWKSSRKRQDQKSSME